MNRHWIAPIVAALGMAASCPAWAQPARFSPGFDDQANVVIVHDPKATDAFKPIPSRIKAMLERGLINLTGAPTATEAWRQLVSTQDIVGIKVLTDPGPTSGTRPEVAAALVESLLASGMPPANVVIWDKSRVDLRQAGFETLAKKFGVQLRGSSEAGWDPDVFYEAPLLGQLAYTDLEFGQQGEGIGRKSHVSKLLTQQITRLINVAPLLNHNRAGVSGLLYSLSLGAVDNTIRFESEPARLATAVPEIYAMPELSDRVALNVVDALVCQYAGEHRSLLHYSATLNELWFSRDPLALDTLALMQLEQQRRNAEMATPTLNKQLYDNASLLQLGVNRPRQIRVERVE